MHGTLHTHTATAETDSNPLHIFSAGIKSVVLRDVGGSWVHENVCVCIEACMFEETEPI